MSKIIMSIQDLSKSRKIRQFLACFLSIIPMMSLVDTVSVSAGERIENCYHLRYNFIRYAQRELLNRGFTLGKADGIFGPLTFQAIREFQLQESIKADGQLNAITIKTLLEVSIEEKELIKRRLNCPHNLSQKTL